MSQFQWLDKLYPQLVTHILIQGVFLEYLLGSSSQSPRLFKGSMIGAAHRIVHVFQPNRSVSRFLFNPGSHNTGINGFKQFRFRTLSKSGTHTSAGQAIRSRVCGTFVCRYLFTTSLHFESNHLLKSTWSHLQ